MRRWLLTKDLKGVSSEPCGCLDKALEGSRKTSKNTGHEANYALKGEGMRQKPRSRMGLTHLDRELSGQNRPDRVTQAGQEAARSTQR